MTRIERRKSREQEHKFKFVKINKRLVSVGLTTLVMLGIVGLSENIEASADTWRATTVEEMKQKVKLEDKQYTFQEGDTFWAISQTINIKAEKLMELNGFTQGSQYSVPVGTVIYWDGDNVKVVDQAGNVIAQETIQSADKVNPNLPIGGNNVNSTNQNNNGNVKGNSSSTNQNSGSNTGKNSNVKDEENKGNGNSSNGTNGGTVTPNPSNTKPEPVDPTNPVDPTEPEKPTPSQTELEKLKAKLAELKAKLAQAKQELAQAEQELANAQSDTNKEELQNKINEQQTVIDTAQATIKAKQAEIASIDSQLSVAQSDLSTAQSNLANANQALSTAQANTATAQQAFDDATTALLADPSNPALQQAVSDTQSALNNAQAQETLAVNAQASAQTAVNTAQSNIDTLNSSKATATSELSTAQSTLSTAQNEKNNLEQQLANVGNIDIPALEAKVKEKQQVVTDLENEIKTVEEKIAELENKEKPKPEPEKVDKTALEQAISVAKGMDTSNYTEETVQTFNEALASANVVMGNKDATQAQVDSATQAINQAIDGLVEKPTEPEKVDKSALQDLINNVKSTDTTKFTEATVQIFNEALASANAVLSNKDATQAQVDSAVSALQTAFDGLKEKPEEVKVDKSALQSVVDSIAKLKQSDYTTASWTKLQTALTQAQNVLDNKDATQSQVDAQVSALNNAKSALVEKADKTALDQAIAKAPTSQGSYTDASWKALQSALSTAKQMSNKEDATQSEVDTATSALNKAISDLKVQKYTITVIHKDQDGKTLDTETFEVEKGKNIQVKSKGFDGYELVGEGSKTLTNIQENGTVTFNYKKQKGEEETIKEVQDTVNKGAIDIWNDYRSDNNKTQAYENDILQKMADQRAKELVEIYDANHTRPNGYDVFGYNEKTGEWGDSLAEEFGYYNVEGMGVKRDIVGENIAKIEGVSLEWIEENGANYVMNAWKNSTGHNNTLLASSANNPINQFAIGSYITKNSDGTYNVFYVALVGYDKNL